MSATAVIVSDLMTATTVFGIHEPQGREVVTSDKIDKTRTRISAKKKPSIVFAPKHSPPTGFYFFNGRKGKNSLVVLDSCTNTR